MKSIDAVYLGLLLVSLFLMWKEARDLKGKESRIDHTFIIALGFSYIKFRLIPEKTNLFESIPFGDTAFWLMFFSLLYLLILTLLLRYVEFLYTRKLIPHRDKIYWQTLYARIVEVVVYKFFIDIFALLCVFVVFLVKG